MFLFVFAVSAVLLMAGHVLATTSVTVTSVSGSDVGTQFYGLFYKWLTGNLGKLLALLGVVGGALGFLFTHNAKVLFYGLFGGALVGGVIGLANMMFDTGSKAFGSDIHTADAKVIQYIEQHSVAPNYTIDFDSGVVKVK